LRSARITVVNNGIDTACFTPAAPAAVQELRTHYAPQGEKILLHVTAAFSADEGHIKGGEHILRLAEKLEGEGVRILVAGAYDARIMPPDNLTFLGRIGDSASLATLYSAADLTVLSSRRETYSMPVAESLSCGTPVVGFLAGGPESIALPDYTQFVPYGDVDALYGAVLAMLHRETDAAEIAKAAHTAYEKEQMYRRYLALYEETVKGECEQ
jgi:glycosyltransferase involved in cell wall biosynthesis